MRIVKELILGWAAFAAGTYVLGQGITTGAAQGTVADPSGAVIANAQVELKVIPADLR